MNYHMSGFAEKIKQIMVKFKDLAAIGSSNLLVSAISAGFWFYIAAILGESSYGEVSYFIAIANIASTIAFIGAGNTVLVYTAKNLNINNSIFSVTIISGLITSIVVFLLVKNIETSIFVLGYVIFGLAINEVLGRKQYKKYAKYLLTQRALQVGLSLGLYYVIGIEGIIFGYALSFLPYLIKVIPIIQNSEKNFGLLKNKIGFMLNSYSVDLTRTFSVYTDKLIIFPIFGFALLGNYQIGIQYLTILSILPNVIFQYILPHDASGRENKKLKIATILVSVIISTISILIIPIIVPIFLPAFKTAIILIQILSLAIVPKTISMMFMSKFLGNEKSKIVVTGTIIYLITQISGILVLGEFYGIEGAAWSLIIASGFEAVFLFGVNTLDKNKNLQSNV
ncbi:MAG: hypothetical protein KGZ37_07910 [Nitrosarchaeum sp.]|nr:hypothetical protein [Nitrosarchaeum sp.]